MDERFLKEEGLEVYTGNELVLKGALESECALITGYPGSPVSEIFDAAFANRELLKKHGVLAEMANNEALSVARLNGSRMAGVRAMAVMKSVGLHVASDGLALGNLSEPNNAGGSIVVVGDDPWIDSTQINNDSRYLSQHLHMPVLEPGTFQELKDWVGAAFELSSAANLYITYLVTTNQADGGGTVWVRPNRYPGVSTNNPVTIDSASIDLDTKVLLPPRTWARELSLPQRFERLLQEVRARKLNELLLPAAEKMVQSGRRWPFAFMTSGLSYCYLEHALSEMGLSRRIPILKLGMTYPVDPQAVLTLAAQAETLYVIEEKRGFIETQVIQILHEARQTGKLKEEVSVWGKKFPEGAAGFPEARGLNASLLSERLIPLLLRDLPNLSEQEEAQIRREQWILEATAKARPQIPGRTPAFCPGCPHRDSSSVFLEIKKEFIDAAYMRRVHGREPVDLIFHGETGCFTMLMFEPNKPLMHNYSGMGLGGGTGAGLDPFVKNKQVVFLGDSTFFHSGMVAVSDSIKSGQDITYVILDNKTTAMTGHQPTPGTGLNIMGESTLTQNIEDILRAMAPSAIPVSRVNPEYRDSYRELLEDTILQDGVKIVIADKECGLTYHRRRRQENKRLLRKQGYLFEERQVNVTPEVCEFCLECTKATGCPGLTIEETPYGPKIVTDLSDCVADGACAKVKACPSFEELIIRRKAPPRRTNTLPPLDHLPDPALRLVEDRWYAHTAGVGGQGAGTVSQVLVRAGQRQGYRVLFSDKKGLAVRNGSVFGHILYSRAGGTLAPLIPYGKADLLLGLDLLEAVRSLDPAQPLRVAHPDRTAAVVNTAGQFTIRMLLGQDKPEPSAWENALRESVRPGGYWAADLASISERYWGTKIYINMLLLGAAYQRGVLPLSRQALEWAIAQSVPAGDRPVNLDAFRLGRALVEDPGRFLLAPSALSYAGVLAERVQFLKETAGNREAQAYRYCVEEAVLELGLDDATHRQLATRVYDMVCYENLAYAGRYLNVVLKVFRRDRADWDYQATKAVIRNAFKVMAIKDEVYVAHLLTSPEKRRRDNLRYRIDPSNGDRVEYRHLNRPEFVLFGKTVRWDMTTRDWQLRLVKRMKFLRKLLPDWHREEKEFRDWYLSLVREFDAEREDVYRLWVNLLSLPEEVRGYREIRRPSMIRARQKAAELMTEIYRVAPIAGTPTKAPV